MAPATRRRWPSRMAGLVMEHVFQWPRARGVAAGIRTHGADRVDRRSDLDGWHCPSRRSSPNTTPARWPTCCGGHSAVIDLADGDRLQGHFHHWIAVGTGVRNAGSRPMGAWDMPAGTTTLTMPLAMARSTDPMSHAYVVHATYGLAIPVGVLLARRRSAARSSTRLYQSAERSRVTIPPFSTPKWRWVWH